MADVATLGLSVDSSELLRGKKAIDDLAVSAEKAEKSGGGLTGALGRIEKLLAAVERAVRDVEGAINRMASGADVAGRGVDGLGRSAQTAAAKVESLSLAATSVSVAYGKVDTAATMAASAATRVVGANSSLSASATGAAAATREVAQAAMAADTALEQQAAAAIQAANANVHLNKAVNDNSIAQKGGSFNAANLAAQFQDVAVTAAMGMNPLQIALQQGTQMAMVFGTTGAAGAMKTLGAAFASVFSPLSFLVIGLTAATAAGLQMVNWTKLAQAGLRGLAAILPTIAPYAAAAAAGLALLYAPAIVAGVTSMVALIARLTVSLGALAVTAAAANPFAALVIGAGLAVGAMGVFSKELEKVLGFNVAASARKGANYIIGAFVAAFGDVKFIWSNFPAIMGSAAVGAANAVLSAMETMINAGSGLLNTFIGTVNQALAQLPGGVQIGQLGQASVGRVADPYSTSLDAAGRARAAQQKAELNRDYLGQIGSALGKGAASASAQLKEWATQLGVVEEKGKKVKTDAEKFADIMAGADRRIASLQAEAAAFGLTEEAAARLRYEQDLLNQASQRDITLSATQRAELAAKAATMAEVETAAKKVKESYDFVRDALGGFINDLRTGLQQGQSFWEAFGNAAENVLNKIIKRIEDDLVNALMDALKAGGFNWGSIFSAAAGSSGSWGSGGIGHAATGGRIAGPGTGTSDTAGLFALSNGEFVINAAATRRWLPLLEAINDNQVTRMAAGGAVGRSYQPRDWGSRMPPGREAVATNFNMQVVNNTGVAAQGRMEPVRGANGQVTGLKLILEAVRQDLIADLEQMGPVSSAHEKRFGLARTRGMIRGG
ncbi:phage tail length tape measure family protein [Xanthobacter tagetidis]|uniref:Phage tail tape-measure protein n=1 Tax=Xanthobacter tagetidis TaxID=60216 RepID=A0A3L7AGI8_9HYPH|nr:phage tail length tape measure family protein [Xanthobacter tagetidis]MBB6306216.1 hypothetical protein [Xanthobacter tagetidis]RLP79499.1 phage tail tape-measure protein [Xanthobacter tagetidis]